MEDEPLWRMTIFIAVFVGMTLIELAFPHHPDSAKARRWANNLTLFLCGMLVVRLVLPLGAVGFAAYASSQRWGLFSALEWPEWLEAIVVIVVFDFMIWGQHVAFHRIGWLWLLHRVHHADEALDITTGLRFHPFEIGLSLAIKLAAIFLLGPSAWAVFVFEVALNAGAMISHANWKLPKSLDHALRLVFVTPGMHRVHHAENEHDTASNFGFNLAIWDRVFGTYKPEPVAGDADMRFGVAGYMDQDEKRIDRLLTQPFRRKT
ncbi:ERG3 Sterol desaturase [Rhabdaerophilaceae bacterium]